MLMPDRNTMSDIFSKRKRSEIMSHVRSSSNKSTELCFVALIKAAGITGWRRKQKLPGRPDFVFRKQCLVVFVDGCFWHSCPKHATFPATRPEFWLKKLNDNKARDRRVTQELHNRGWNVLRIWEHELKKPEHCIAKVIRVLSCDKRHHSKSTFP